MPIYNTIRRISIASNRSGPADEDPGVDADAVVYLANDLAMELVTGVRLSCEKLLVVLDTPIEYAHEQCF